jgi:hypothetical protein
MSSRPVPDVGLGWLLARCDRVGPHCLRWRQRAVVGRYPATRIGGQHWYVRRLLWLLVHAVHPPSGTDVVVACGHPRCVSPECLMLRPARAARGAPA